MYEPSLGRFMTIDPIAEKFNWVTPYNYAKNNPSSGIDLWGLQFFPTPLLGIANTPISSAARPIILAGNSNPITLASRFNPIQWHHIIPKALRSHRVVRSAERAGFKFNKRGGPNMIPLERFLKSNGKGVHGNHPRWNAEVLTRLNRFMKNNPDFTPKQAADFLIKTTKNLKSTIENNPGIKINELYNLAPATVKRDATRVVAPLKVISKEASDGVKSCAYDEMIADQNAYDNYLNNLGVGEYQNRLSFENFVRNRNENVIKPGNENFNYIGSH